MNPRAGLLLAALAGCGAPPPPAPAPRPAASASETDRERHEVEARASADAPWVQRQKERHAAFLAHQSCVEGCKGEQACEDRCGAPPPIRARCAPCSLSSRCQVLSEESTGTLDCCLPLTDERRCIPAQTRLPHKTRGQRPETGGDRWGAPGLGPTRGRATPGAPLRPRAAAGPW
jgi:hypothetical protein